jgi:hypothetical protein
MFETILSESSSERAHTYHQRMTEEKPNRPTQSTKNKASNVNAQR